MASTVRVMVVDDQMMARGYLSDHIGASSRYEVVASFGSAELAVAYCAEHPVDLAVLDVVLRGGPDGLEAAAAIKRESPSTKVVVVTSMPEVSYLERARAAHVESFWYKEYADRPLLEVLDATMAGESVYPDAVPEVRLGDALSSDFTAQELVVLREMTTGASNAQIADRLYLSVHTVRTHVRHLLEKTGYATRTQLAVNASLAGLVVARDDEGR